jgi:Dihaem cytochrome c
MHSRFMHLIRSAVAVSVLVAAPVWADSYKGPPPPAVYTQECGSCHLAFPPNLLPKASRDA